MGGQRQASASLLTGMMRYPLYGGCQGHRACLKGAELSLLPILDPRTVQPVANRYTN